MVVEYSDKFLEYTGDISPDLFSEFRPRLRNTERLVVGCCGFGDKGINGQLIERLLGGSSRRMVWVHPQPERQQVAAGGTVQDK
jgi:hypothetical protein